jgi:hypothetical protein
MAITGVMPLPPVMNSARSGIAAGQVNSPWAWESSSTLPGVMACTRCCETRPPGIALTVMRRRPPDCSGALESE